MRLWRGSRRVQFGDDAELSASEQDLVQGCGGCLGSLLAGALLQAAALLVMDYRRGGEPRSLGLGLLCALLGAAVLMEIWRRIQRQD